MNTTRVGILTLLAAVTLSLSACGSTTSTTSTTSTSAPTAGSATPDASTITLASSSLGKILVDGSGRTLYLFTSDGDNATTSTCTGACAQTWTAVKGKPAAGAGVDANLIGGSTQATYAGHLLYYYTQDATPGDVNGQGVGGTWYVLNKSGAAVKTAVSSGTIKGY